MALPVAIAVGAANIQPDRPPTVVTVALIESQ